MPLWSGPPDVGKLAGKRDMRGLEKALQYRQDASVRSSAAKALRFCADERATRALVAALGDPDAAVRAEVAETVRYLVCRLDLRVDAMLALAALDLADATARKNAGDLAVELRRSACVDALVPALEDPKRRPAAADLLVRMGSGAAGALERRLVRDGAAGRAAALEALARIGGTGLPVVVNALGHFDALTRQAAEQSLAGLGESAADSLVGGLARADDQVNRYAEQALMRMGAPAVAALLRALHNPTTRSAAAATLEKMGWQLDRSADAAAYWIAKGDWERCLDSGELAAGPLLAALIERNTSVNAAAETALTKLGPPAVATLIGALRSQDWLTRGKAAKVLGAIGDARAVRPLAEALRDETDFVRQWAAKALGSIGTAEVVEALISALNDRHFEVRGAAARALGGIGDLRAVDALIGELPSDAAAEALGRIGGDAAVTGLVRHLPSANVAEALERIGNASAVEPLISALGSKLQSERRAAGRALATLYRSGWLDEPSRLGILAQRGRLASPHVDQESHTDISNDPSQCIVGRSERHHTDEGFGIDLDKPPVTNIL